MNYKHFSKKELNCSHCGGVNVDDDFMDKICMIREELGQPMVVTSFYRCKEYNEEIGGAPKSAHLDGEAMDITKISDSYARRVVELAIKHEINGIEVGTHHIHLDDKERIAPVIWAGRSV